MTLSLFDLANPYPDTAGYKVPGPSQEAAQAVDASRLRVLCLTWLKSHGAHTADEIAAGLQQSILTIRPRVSELRAGGQVRDTGERRRNASGKRATVWTAA